MMKPQAVKEMQKPSVSNQKAGKTRIVVKYDVGFGNILYIRGKGANLNWDRGIALKNTKSDEWVWETDLPIAAGEFKILINDNRYELGDNHPIKSHAAVEIKPRFS
ncbi:MAG: hypothetical protein LLG04_09470 [Parachlamydia sp.]|nr:hypothetical protein [Parachlamydia sp.]